jgi:hypothetical protein
LDYFYRRHRFRVSLIPVLLSGFFGFDVCD